MLTTKKVRRLLALLVVGLVCFSLAVFFVTKVIIGESSENSNGVGFAKASHGKDSIFSQAIQIGREGRFLSVPSSLNLLPTHKKDYLLFFWFNLRSLPDVGDRLVLLSKYTGAPPKIKGFAIGLSRDSNSLRPVLFWGDGSSAGAWHDFPEISITTNEWNLFALHVHKDRFVGMYSARLADGNVSPVKFLGGHEITLVDPLDLGTADLVFGAPVGRDFRGKLGPLAIINPLSIGFEELTPAINSYVKSPLDFSILGSKSEYQLMIEDGRNDSSLNKNAIVTTY